jgi:transposase-like protein
VYRAIDQFGQVIDVFVTQRGDATAARRFFERAVSAAKRTPIEVVPDKAPTYPAVLEEMLPAAWHRTDRNANNHIEADHGRRRSRLSAMRGFNQDRSARIVIAVVTDIQTPWPRCMSNRWRRQLHASVGLPEGYRGAAGTLLAAFGVDLDELGGAFLAELGAGVP